MDFENCYYGRHMYLRREQSSGFLCNAALLHLSTPPSEDNNSYDTAINPVLAQSSDLGSEHVQSGGTENKHLIECRTSERASDFLPCSYYDTLLLPVPENRGNQTTTILMEGMPLSCPEDHEQDQQPPRVLYRVCLRLGLDWLHAKNTNAYTTNAFIVVYHSGIWHIINGRDASQDRCGVRNNIGILYLPFDNSK